MMRSVAAVLVLLLAGAACGDDDTGQADPAPETTTTSTTSTTTTGSTAEPTTTAPAGDILPIEGFETVVGDLSVPWEIAFVDAGTVLVTERTGVVRVVEGGELRDGPVLELDAVAAGEGGVLGMALHPDFPDERVAYVYYTAEGGNRVSRFDVAEDLTMSGEQTLLEGIPAARNHDGGRIAFGPDGHLYVTTGDAGDPELAVDRASLAGKILRITTDGEVPDGNPFPGSPVWSYGHRNPQGLAWTGEGTMYATEHGPSGEFGLCCNDELNRIDAGGFYGWPYLAGTTDTGQGDPPTEPIPPVATSGGGSTWAPSGVAVAAGPDGEALLVAGLRGEALLRFDIAADGLVAQGAAIDGLGRLRVATVGPDDCLWLATSNTDGRGDPAPNDDRLLRAC